MRSTAAVNHVPSRWCVRGCFLVQVWGTLVQSAKMVEGPGCGESKQVLSRHISSDLFCSKAHAAKEITASRCLPSPMCKPGISPSSRANFNPLPSPAYFRRAIRRQEMQVWHGPNVGSMRRVLTLRAYACLAIYTLVIAWINLCYVATYDAEAVR